MIDWKETEKGWWGRRKIGVCFHRSQEEKVFSEGRCHPYLLLVVVKGMRMEFGWDVLAILLYYYWCHSKYCKEAHCSTAGNDKLQTNERK